MFADEGKVAGPALFLKAGLDCPPLSEKPGVVYVTFFPFFAPDLTFPSFR